MDPAVLANAGLAVARGGAPIFIGIWISWVAYGTTVILVPNYLFAYRKNPLRERLFIIFLFLLNTAEVALDLSRIIKIYVTHFGDALYLIDFHRRIEDAVLTFTSVVVIFFSMLFLSVKTHGFLGAGAEGRLRSWQWPVAAYNVVLVAAATAFGLVGQWKLTRYSNYITLAAATYHQWATTYSLMRLLFILSCILWLLPQVYILSLELFEAKKWQVRHEDDGERRLRSASTKLSIALRNGSPVLLLQLLVLALVIVEGKSWSLAASTALPRLYTIYVVLWVFVPRPRKSSGASSHTTSTVPDLTWSSQSDPHSTNASGSGGRGDLPTPTDGARPSSSSLGRLHPSQLFSRQGRRDWRASLAEVKLRKTRGRRKAPTEPKAYVVDLGDEEESAGRTGRRTTLIFPDDDVEGRAGADADEAKFGGGGAGEKFDDAADWRAGLVMQESQSHSQYLPTLLRHRASLPSSGLRSSTPEHDDALPGALSTSTYTAPLSPASPTAPAAGLQGPATSSTVEKAGAVQSPTPKSALELFGLDEAEASLSLQQRKDE